MLKKARMNANVEPVQPKQLKSIKIRVYPNKAQQEMLKRWFGTARWTYNQCLSSCKKAGRKLYMGELRSLYVNSKADIVKENSWIEETPYEVRDQAMNDVIRAYESNDAKGPNHNFKIKYKSKKHDVNSIAILKKSWTKGGFFPTFFGKKPLKSKELLPQELPADSRLIRTRLNEYYLCIPKPIEIRPDNQRPVPRWVGETRTIAVDPGVRTFNTGYDLDGISYEWGKADIG
jgi:transposase